jgi:hypothetical protein
MWSIWIEHKMACMYSARTYLLKVCPLRVYVKDFYYSLHLRARPKMDGSPKGQRSRMTWRREEKREKAACRCM